MADANQILEQYFFEMRWRCLSLAADLDRVERADGGKALLNSDIRIQKLRQALELLATGDSSTRAEHVQLIFSDKTPPPK